MSQSRVTRQRLSAEDRRSSLLSAASELLTEHGEPGVQIHDVAERAGVSRPIVYRFFETREALFVALLEDMEKALERRMKEALVVVATGRLDDAVRAMVEACVDAVEEKGVGPWRLLDARGAGPALSLVGRAIQARMLAPWLPLIRERTGLKPRDAELVMAMVVAAGRAALDGFFDGRVTRARAVDAAARAVRTILAEFTR